MNKIKQRIAIAKACRWEPETFGPDWWQSESKMPDYPNDLNAMHEAEKVLRDKWDSYFGELISIRSRDALKSQHPADLSPAGATAAQRAEAFLKTLNLWEYQHTQKGTK